MSYASGYWAGAPIAAAPLSSIIRWWAGARPDHSISGHRPCEVDCDAALLQGNVTSHSLVALAQIGGCRVSGGSSLRWLVAQWRGHLR